MYIDLLRTTSDTLSIVNYISELNLHFTIPERMLKFPKIGLFKKL